MNAVHTHTHKPSLQPSQQTTPVLAWSPVCEELWTRIAQLDTPGFFITAEVQEEGDSVPEEIFTYIAERLNAFQRGVTSRKFVFRSHEWRIYLTFFSTRQVVEERYALKNKVMKTKKTMISLSGPK